MNISNCLNYAELEHNLGDIQIKKILNRNFVSNHNYIRGIIWLEICCMLIKCIR